MTVRSNAEFESTLPKYDIKPSEDFKEFALVRCPRDDCPSHTKDDIKPFLVHKRTWLRPKKIEVRPDRLHEESRVVVIHGRPCPYCAKVSTIRR
jgi:hypothetical protein